MKDRKGKSHKLVLGLTGGVGAGKSTVLGFLEKDYGALILEADRICNSLIEPGSSTYGAILDLLGREILLPGGEIDRKAMAAMIFADGAKLRAVNGILHPATFEAVRERIARSRKKLIVYESAIPFEARFSELCHKVLYVYASPATRQARLMSSRGYSLERVRSIMGSQPEEDTYYRLADGVVHNDSSPEACRESLARILKDWGIEAGS